MKRWLGVAAEGWPVIFVLAVGSVAFYLSPWPFAAIPVAALILVAMAKFQDPEIRVKADPNGVLSPISGRVSSISRNGSEIRMLIRSNPFGPYVLRAPVEGTLRESQREHGGHGITLRTDEGEDIYLRLYGPRWFAPVATIDYGGRIGQGQRCGLLRLATAAELVLPADSVVKVAKGNRVLAGRSLLATVGEPDSGHDDAGSDD